MKIGHKLKVLRIAKKIEPVEMACRLGISESTYRRYERDESEISIGMLYKIAHVFCIKVSDLLEEDIYIIIPNLRSSTDRMIQDYEKHIESLKQTVLELKTTQQRR